MKLRNTIASIIALGLLGIAAVFAVQAPAPELGAPGFTERTLPEKKQALTAIEKRAHNRGAVRIELVDIQPIEGGVEVFARAWKNGRQIGFGSDGTVDIERFRIINPPVLVPDAQGPIVRTWTDMDGNEITYRLREDPEEALLQVIVHNLTVMKNIHGNEKIVSGKVGRTTTTVYPDPDAESTSVDGFAFRSGVSETWSTIRAGAGTSHDDAGANVLTRTTATTNTDQWADIIRTIALFDTSSIADTDTVDSATLSFYGTWVDEDHESLGAGLSVNIYGATPASNTDLVNSDYGNTGTTAYSDSAITTTTWADGSVGNPAEAYNNFTLNATGISNVSLTGVSKFSLKLVADSDNSSPTWSSGDRDGVRAYSADQTGTTQDPKLVIEHTAAAASGQPDTISKPTPILF